MLCSCGERQDAAVRAGQAAAAAVGKSRAGGGQRQVEEDEGVRDQPDGLLDGASGQGDEEWRRAAAQATQT